MSEIQEKGPNVPAPHSTGGDDSSDQHASDTHYIDPIKEMKMMRKFDVGEDECSVRNRTNDLQVLLYRHDGSLLFASQLGPV